MGENSETITHLLTRLSKKYGVPLSTLKLNARILRDMNLISYGSVKNKRDARLETLGELVINIIEGKPSTATILVEK